MLLMATTFADPIEKIDQTCPAVVDFSGAGTTAASLIGFTSDAAYVSRKRQQFPVRVRKQSGKLICFVSVIVEYLRTGESQAQFSVPIKPKKFKVKTGRPGKLETIEASKYGLTVREYRTQKSLDPLLPNTMLELARIAGGLDGVEVVE